MKMIHLSLGLVLVAAVAAAGCGSTQTTPVATAPGVYGGAAIPGAYSPYGGISPLGTGGYCMSSGYNYMGSGSYYGGYYGGMSNNCCPLGYMQSGSTCTVATGAAGMCTSGTTWNGVACQPTGFGGCPGGMTWTWSYGACQGSSNYGYGYSGYPGYTCNGYYCYYTGGSPYGNGYYWNGYWYVRL